MPQTVQKRQTHGRSRRGYDFVLEGVPMYDSPDISSDSSDIERTRTMAPPHGQNWGPAAYPKPSAAGAVAPPYRHQKQQQQQQQQQQEHARQQLLLQQKWLEQQQAAFHQRQQELSRAEYQRSHKTQQQSQQSSHNHTETRDARRTIMGDSTGRGSRERCPPVDDIDYVKYFPERGPRVMEYTSPGFNTNPSTTVAQHIQSGHNAQFTTMRPSARSQQHLECPGNHNNTVVGAYGTGETADTRNTGARETAIVGGGVHYGAQSLQATGKCAARYASTLYLENDHPSAQVPNGYTVEMGNSGLFTLANYPDADKGAVTNENRFSGGAVKPRWTSVSTTPMECRTPPSVATAPQYRNTAACDSTGGDIFSGDYEFMPVELGQCDFRTLHAVTLSTEPTPPFTPSHASVESRGGKRNALLPPVGHRDLSYFESLPQKQQKQQRRTSKQGDVQDVSEASLPFAVPQEYQYLNNDLTDPNSSLPAPAMSVETTHKSEKAQTRKVIDSSNPRRWIVL
ncbi:uncharacterized protein TEOVI_000191000 [Trypanosoma equiperdum]|uniref:T. brucei spp.-specific protein n=2 Tax=Trypanozoon TaxID=39700 RepID=Q57V76_TRYB2|nr:hypothetical protein Tb927.8.7550 [Trypanosoma brucei brucei TREU927]AAX70481.1 hypothetical protein Tb927.8.7550 [Trypanosoma brucei]AAZ13518.1 hypothetical protein Tb927.8.7550 [Trypanosoma brucei brucei TREU927]SCU70337.1 hypothetical protein, conserved [Trypanosoma equiperdum]